MDYQYVGCTGDNRIVKGKISAASEAAVTDMLAYSGYRVISLKEITPFFRAEKLTAMFSSINPTEIIMFSRQLALLIESGTDIVTSLELLHDQVTNGSLKKIIGHVVSDVRGGSPISQALGKYPKAFPEIYHRLVSVGEKTGNLEQALRRAADDIERGATTKKGVKNALLYPAIVSILAVIVIGVMVAFVFPAFTSLYASFNAQLPATTRALIAATDWLLSYGLWLLLGIVVVMVVGYGYTRTPTGKYQWGKLMLTLPRIGRINLLNELSQCCRTMALLFSSGLPLPEIMTLVIHGTKNKAMEEALTEVQKSMIAGEGLSSPMAKNRLFMPLMVQMTRVGEKTGNLDNMLSTVAESYETEADEKTKAMIALLTPAMTIVIGSVVGFLVLSLVSAMYSIYGSI